MAKKKKPKTRSSKKTSSTLSRKVTPKRNLPDFFYDIKLNLGLIMLFSFVLYGMTIFYNYTQDDAIVITDNMYTTQGVKGISGILTKDTFYGFFKKDGKASLVDGGRYRPLTLIMFAVEWSIFGDNPLMFHLLTVLLYGLTGIVLYLLLLKMLRPSKGDDFAFFVALATTFLFMAHPIHTEVVANIKGRDEIVVLLGSLAAVYFSLKSYYEKNPIFNIVAAGIFFLALLAKENAITFLAVVPLVYFMFTKANTSKILIQTAPFLGMAVLFMVIRTSVLGWNFGGECTELMNCPYLKVEGGGYVPFTNGEKFATIFYTLGQYVKLLFFPHPLTHDYYPYHIGIMNFGDWRVILSLLMYVGLGIYALLGILKKDVVAFGIAFYIITLSIVSNLVFPVGTNMAERFAFMPSVGFCLVLGVLAYRLAVRFSKQNDKRLSPSSFTTPIGLVAVAIILFSLKTVTRNPAWKDNHTLFMTDVKVSKNSAKLQNSAGGTMIEEAIKLTEDSPQQIAMLNEAVEHLNTAIKIHPNYKSPYLLLGNAHQYLKKFDKAIQYYNQALRVAPDFPDAENNLTLAYQNGGKYFGEKQNNIKKSLEFLNKAYQRDPTNVETLRLLGIAYGIARKGNKAVEFLEKALKLQPENPSIMFNLGIALANNGQPERGQQLMQKAKQLDPSIGQ